MRRIVFALACLTWFISGGLTLADDTKLKALIVDGQNNHGVWPKTTQMMKSYLVESGKFDVDVATTGAKSTKGFEPKFTDYDVVISNYNGQPWQTATQTAFVDYVKNGGGFVVVHAADNAFPEWDEYNRIIGLGGWGAATRRVAPTSISTRMRS